jgi:hypothetical protein
MRTHVISFAGKIVPMRANEGPLRRPQDLADDGSPKLISLLVNIAVILGPLFNVARKVIRIVNVGHSVLSHRLDLIGNTPIQPRRVTVTVHGGYVRLAIRAGRCQPEDDVRARNRRGSARIHCNVNGYSYRKSALLYVLERDFIGTCDCRLLQPIQS